MRIQHNIMAMNAYRNYNNNTSALAKNLEKLSSGYRINRAGDDAAGLAISEKMRAQITALGTAQKNVKDGISLVKTAEGATQEIHDMLNRMVDLATQSANGTYQDDVDRDAIQDEYNALKEEINRITKAANFNGITLLDGSLNSTKVDTLVTSTVGETLGTNTVLHKGGVDAAQTEFSVDLHDVKFSNETGDKLTLKIGNNTFTLDAADTGVAAGTALTASDIASAFVADKFKDADGNAVDHTAVELTDGTNTGNFTAAADGTRITFTQDAADTTPVDGDMSVEVTGPGAAAVGAGTTTITVTGYDATNSTAPANNVTASFIFDLSTTDTLAKGNYEVKFNGQTIQVNLTQDNPTANDLAAGIAAKLGDIDDGSGAGTNYTVTTAGTKLTFTAGTKGTTPNLNTDLSAATFDIAGKALPAGEASVTGDWNKTTTVTAQGATESADRLASGVATFTKDTFADGNVIKVGDKTYEVSTDAADKTAADKVYVGDLKLDEADGLKTAIDRLSVAADSNSVWTVGHGTTAGQVTFVEKVNNAGDSYTKQNTTGGKLKDGAFDLSKEDVIKETFGTVTGSIGDKAGNALVLQIGEDSEDYNQLSVDIAAMDTKSLGLDDVDLDTQKGAQEAVSVIKNAINQVSTTRGKLGALQNRLEHTGNNLSTMKENIQDAEATIRDTDIAEEMMAYTKNNILVQSAQAMLAQANQIPQGVLQLLG